MDEKDVVYIYTMGYYSATRKDNILSFFFTTWMNPGQIMLREISQTCMCAC